MKKVIVLIVLAAVAAYVFLFAGGGGEIDRRALVDKNLRDIKNEYSKKNKPLSPQQEVVTKIQLAVLDYMAGAARPPAVLEDLVPVYFDSVPLNPATKEPFAYKVQNGQWLLGNEVAFASNTSSEGDEDGSEQDQNSILASLKIDGEEFIAPSMIKEDPFVYDATGLRDPFTPFNLAPTVEREGMTELERYALGQLKLTVVLDDNEGGYFAMVENSEGIGFKVVKGTKIGNKGGEVITIEKDRIKILEQHTTFTGEEKTEVQELKLIR